MSHAHHDPTVPKGALIMAAALILFTMALAAAVRLGLMDMSATPAADRVVEGTAAVAERSLHFADTDTGAVVITDANTGDEIAHIGTETEGGGFIRGVLRGLARERRMHGFGDAQPFALTLWQDGALSLTDQATGRVVELGAFGADNRATFVALLERGDG